MTAAELISALRALGPQDQRVRFTFLADRIREARLKDGRHLTLIGDFEIFLRELADASKLPPGFPTNLGPPRLKPAAQSRYQGET